MTDKVITASHTLKLGHSLREIRERALFNIKSKLDNGFTYDNELARSKEVLTKLFEWFLHEPCTHQEIVFTLIKQVLNSKSGGTLIGHYGTSCFKNEITQLRRFLEPQFHQHLQEILSILEDKTHSNEIVVPPLETDIPLSYRSGQTDFLEGNNVGTTATTIEGFIHEESSVRQDAGDCSYSPISRDCYIIEPLQWQNLIEPDRHVLHSVQNSIQNSSDPGGVLHSAEFFSNVLLSDFPAEIFLQRPTIINGFFTNLTDCASSRLSIAILKSLYDLTKALHLRVNQYKDPCMYNAKNFVIEGSKSDSGRSTPESNCRRSLISGQSADNNGFKIDEDLASLKRRQMSLPQFCTECLKTVLGYLNRPNVNKFANKLNQAILCNGLKVLDEVVKLLSLILTNNVWKEEKTGTFMDIFKNLTGVMVSYGDSLEYFRIEVLSDDSSNLSVRAFQLCLLKNCLNFLQVSTSPGHCALVLPRNLKNALANCLVDVVLAKLYPDTHRNLLNIVESFSIGRDTDSLRKYKKVHEICGSISAFMKFMNCDRSSDLKESLKLARNSLICLEFHKNIDFISKFIDICATKLPLDPTNPNLLAGFEYVTLKLLAYDNVPELREEMYKLCRKKVAKSIGPKLNLSGSGAPGAQILFLTRFDIFIEITTHGLTSDNPEIMRCAEDILIHVLKSKILVPDDIWDRIVEALIPSLPIILCFADKTSSLGRTCLNLIDPDSARDLYIPEIEVIRGNVALLFCDDSQAREEGFSRLCWLISSQHNSRDLLPRLNNLYDRALPNVCQIGRPVEINRNKAVQHFYQPSSLQQVLDLLKSRDVEPVIRRSALTQIGVMTEDPLLHPTFLENSGISVIADIMKSSLLERDFHDYPDSVIPAVTIFKNLCLYNPVARQELALNVDVLFCVLRGLFMFFTEERMRQDGSLLLFLLCFRDFITGSPSKGDFSLPRVVLDKLKAPLICKSHWKESPHVSESLQELMADRWALSSIQIQWNSETCGGIRNLLSLENASMVIDDVPHGLKLRNYDLELLKAASIEICIDRYLAEVQNSTTHSSLIDSINKLTTYLLFHKIYGSVENLTEMAWKSTFSRFLKALPSSADDEDLLTAVLRFLNHLTNIYKHKGDSWLSSMLKNPSNVLFGLLHTEKPDDEDDSKLLAQHFLTLIKSVAIINEDGFLNRLSNSEDNEIKPSNDNWSEIIEKLADHLKFDDTLQFYNLSYLDSLLSCLVHLTATRDWFTDIGLQRMQKLVAHLCELAVVFHRGKGSITTVSVMGLSVTRHVILILNHIVSELINSKARHWESCFTDLVKRDWMNSFSVHRSSRDVILRAATLQFFAGLAKSPRLAVEIVNDLKCDNRNIWQIALDTLMDEDEASITKESCANLLSSLTSHMSIGNDGNWHLVPGLVPKCGEKDGGMSYVLKLFDDGNFYKNLVSILYNLYTNRMIGVDSHKKLTEYNNIPSGSVGSSSGSLTSFGISTPTLVENLSILVENVLKLSPDLFLNKLHENGLVRLFFRCICNPTMDTSDLKRMSLFCAILEMDSAITSLLRQLAGLDRDILGTILHTRDCLTLLMTLANPKSYDTSYPQVLFLRNKLWSQVFNLLVVLSSFDNDNQRRTALVLLLEAVDEAGSQAFFETICETLKPTSSHDVRNCTLRALISLSEIDTDSCITDSAHTSNYKSSLRHLLDSSRLSVSSVNLLENVYFKKRDGGGDYCFECTIAGAEICRILLNLYDLCSLKADKKLIRQKSLIVGALSSILAQSRSAKKLCLHSGLLQLLLKRLSDSNLELGLESVDLLRRVTDKKRLLPLLQELDELIGLVTNFMANDDEIKMIFAENGISDLVHKLWAWFATQKCSQLNVIKMLATFTNDCPIACQSVALTSSVGGSGLRRVPGKVSLLNSLVTLIEKEMERISKTHDLAILGIAFHVIGNCCCALDCRNLLAKSSLLQGVGRLHPAVTKRQNPWESVEKIWLDFLQVFSLYPEGQSAIAKINDVFELLLALTLSSKPSNRLAALLVLRNISFYQPNRGRLLISGEFINVLRTKLDCGNDEEKTAVVIMMWALAANNQKAKVTFKSAQLDLKLLQILKRYELKSTDDIQHDAKIDQIRYVLDMIRDNIVT